MRLTRADKSVLSDWWFTVDRLMFFGLLLLMGAGLVLSLAASPPIAERYDLEAFYFVRRHAALLLPAIALALPQAAILARVTRSALLEVLGEDYIRTARAKGMPRKAVLWRHALRNAMIPVLTILGLQFAFLLAGTIIIENVFYLPGLGRLVFQAITQRDLIVVEGVVMLLVASVVLVNILVDICYALVDPRLRTR
jgi:ABC-type dipeptide/oligopeptide/nickel transport system permease component